MALYQTVDIDKPVDGTSPPTESRWVAVHNPVYLEYQRKDYEFANAYASGGFLTLDFSASTGALVDDILYINCPGVYTGLAQVTGFVSTYDLKTNIAVSLAPGTYPGYANNLTRFANYFVELQIWNHSNSVQLATLRATPDTTGLIGIDISGALQSYTDNKDSVTYPITADNDKDENATVQFKYRIAERWRPASGLVEQAFGSYSAFCYGINGSFPIGTALNGNYADYYPTPQDPKSFITDFERPKYFEGYPFDVAFILTDDFSLVNVNFITTQFDATGAQVGGSSYQLNLFNGGYLVRAVPDLDFSGAANPVKSLKVQMQLDPGNDPILTDLYIDVVAAEDACDGIYLIWLGEKGNRSHYFFNNRFTESMQVDGGDTYQTAFDGIADLRERANWYEKKAFKKLTLGAEGLSRNDIEGLKSLLKSTKVDVIDPVTYLRTGVLVEPGTFTIGRGDDQLFRVEFSIVFPEQFNQTA